MAEGIEGDSAQNYFLIEGDVYEVEKLVGIKVANGKKLYKVRWKGYSAQSDTYEPEENLFSCKDMIAELEEKLEKKRQKKLKMANADEPEASTSAQSSQENSEHSSRDQSKDTFWKDFNEGKINVFGQDMYSKVKERAARSVSQNENQGKETQPPVCPKVVLKRRTNPKNSSIVPTYKSTLQIKPVVGCLKRHKRPDTSKLYRTKSRSPRRLDVDENKNFETSLSDDSNEDDDPLYQMKARSVICHSKSPIKAELQTSENSFFAEFSKVLQELPANDEIGCSDALDYAVSLPNFTFSKILIDSARIIQSVKSEESSGNTKDIKSEQRKGIDNKSEMNQMVDGFPSGAGASNLTYENKLTAKYHILWDLEKIPLETKKLDVAPPPLVKRWSSLSLEEKLQKFLKPGTPEYSSNWHTFDLLMASSIQGKIETLEKMCLRGAYLNHTLSDGTTVLMIVSQLGLFDIVKVLLTYSAYKDLQNQYGETALMLACSHKRPQVVKLLLEQGANFALTSTGGVTASKLSKDIPAVRNILDEHISRVKAEFESKARLAVSSVAAIRYALFPIHCLSANEGPKFVMKFSHDVDLEAPGKVSKDFVLFIANCTIRGNYVHCDFRGDSGILSVTLNGARQENLQRDNNSLVKIPRLLTGVNEVCITTAQRPHSQMKLVVCGYRVFYHENNYASSAGNLLTGYH